MNIAFRTTLLAAALAVALAGCAPVTALNVVAPASTYEASLAVPYGTASRQKLDVYRPVAAPPVGGYPVVVFFYGGTWNNGERANYKFVGEALASRGILALVADYRLYPEVRYPDFLADSAQAVAYALERASAWGGNQKRVFAMGHSAGGYNAAMLALDPRWLKSVGHAPSELSGWIGLAGAYDFLPSSNPDVQPVFHHPNYPEGALPVVHVKPGAPPAFLGAAKKDPLVDPQRNTAALAERLREAQVPVEMKMYTRVNHIMLIGSFSAPFRWLSSALDDSADFVNRTNLPKH